MSDTDAERRRWLSDPTLRLTDFPTLAAEWTDERISEDELVQAGIDAENEFRKSRGLRTP